MVRGVIKCCSREREYKRMRLVPSGVRVGKSFCEKLLYYGATLQRAAVSKNKEHCLGHDNNLIFRVCNLMISSQKSPAA